MGALFVCAILFMLGLNDIISTTVVIIGVFASIAWIYIGAGLYFATGFLSWFYHGLLEWHRPDDSPEWFDGLSVHCRCRHCGKPIMQDSQGNWFTFD